MINLVTCSTPRQITTNRTLAELPLVRRKCITSLIKLITAYNTNIDIQYESVEKQVWDQNINTMLQHLENMLLFVVHITERGQPNILDRLYTNEIF